MPPHRARGTASSAISPANDPLVEQGQFFLNFCSLLNAIRGKLAKSSFWESGVSNLRLILMVVTMGWMGMPALASLTPVDTADEAMFEESASLAFWSYLQAIDEGELADAYEMVLDPIEMTARDDVVDRLSAFIRARQKNPVDNEAIVVRFSGQWALIVYQYDTIVAGKPARVITTAWMMQSDGFWRQFIVAPADETFWDRHRSDYERLQNWFDEHAADLQDV